MTAITLDLLLNNELCRFPANALKVNNIAMEKFLENPSIGIDFKLYGPLHSCMKLMYTT